MDLSWPAEFVPLALLQSRSLHGYDLHRRISEDAVLRSIWRLGRSELYFLLKKLERRGWITPQAVDITRGPPRTSYGVSEAGRLALDTWLATPVPTPRDLRAEFLAKVYLGRLLGASQTERLLRDQSEILRGRLEAAASSARASGFQSYVHRLRQLQTEAALAWLEELASTAGESVAAEPDDGEVTS